MIQKEKTFLIVDGHNLLFQMFYGMPSRIVNQDGKAIQGVLGFVGALIKIIKQINPQYMVVLFDGEHENKRAEILSEYKANRIDYGTVADEENPFSQLEDVYKALEFMGIPFIEVDEVEVDDVIASYAYKYGNDMQIVISSWDSDFFQLISEHVKVLRYRGKSTIVCDSEFMQDKFGIMPEVYADFKALVGDKADNIKGAEGIGVKTAGRLLGQYGSLQEIIDNTDNESIVKNKDRLLLNYQLIKLNDKAKLPFSIEELQYTYNEVTTSEVLKGIGL